MHKVRYSLYLAGYLTTRPPSVRIPPDIIQQIQLQADIVEVVGDYVSLKKQGQNMWACCPFHNEKTPSFSVAPAKGIFKCFGCGKAGDTVKFVMEVEGVSYPEALRHLARKYNIEIPEAAPDPEEIQRQSGIDSLYIVLNFAKEFYQKTCWRVTKENPSDSAISGKEVSGKTPSKPLTSATASPHGTRFPGRRWREVTSRRFLKKPVC